MSEQRVLVWLVIEQDGAVLLARRKSDTAPFAGQWVLPGDEMPEAESATETQRRFAREQLDIGITGADFANTLYVSEGEVEYAINVFRVRYAGRPRFRESGPYSEVRWTFRDELNDIAAFPMPETLRGMLAATTERSQA
jgi:ADP-ribose pyrophosphatase YjhB (NUDIX family)